MPEFLASEEVRESRPLFSQGVKVGNTIFVSGQVAVDRGGNVVGKGDMTAQTHQVIRNIRAVLAAGGARLEDVVKLTMYVTDMARAGEARAVRLQYFKPDPPASTGVQGAALGHPDLLIEIEAVAMVTTS